jgi:hypothetical protein
MERRKVTFTDAPTDGSHIVEVYRDTISGEEVELHRGMTRATDLEMLHFAFPDRCFRCAGTIACWRIDGERERVLFASSRPRTYDRMPYCERCQKTVLWKMADELIRRAESMHWRVNLKLMPPKEAK